MKKLAAISLLALFIVRHFFLKLWRLLSRGSSSETNEGERRFFHLYADDDITPISAEVREANRQFSRCIGCKICDMLCENTATLKALWIARPSAAAMAHTRLLTEQKHALATYDALLSCEDCTACTGVCPMGIPLKEAVSSFRDSFDEKAKSV